MGSPWPIAASACSRSGLSTGSRPSSMFPLALCYDARGNGMSDWDVDDISLDAWVSDLECVVEANRVERFPLLGMSQGCSVAVAYAVCHPERVSRLILYGGFAVGSRHRGLSAEQLEEFAAMRTLTRVGLGADNPAFRQMFTTQFMPDATEEQMDAFNELQRQSASAACAVRYPTLVLHVRDGVRGPTEF